MNKKLFDFLNSNIYINKKESKMITDNINLKPFVNKIDCGESDIFTNFLKFAIKKNLESQDIETLKNMLDGYEANTNLYITDLTLANIYLYIKNYKMAKIHIEKHKQKKGITIEIVGKTAKAKYFNCIENDFLAIEITDKNNGIKNKELFVTDKLKYIDYYVSPLSITIQEILLTELEYILHTEMSEEYKLEKISAYIDILKYKKNPKHPLLTRLINYYNTYVDTKEYYHLEKDLYYNNDCDFLNQYNIPVKFIFEIKERLAHVFFKQFRYENALEIYKELSDTENMIRCYVGLNKEKDAIIEAKNRIEEYKKEIEKIENLLQRGDTNINKNFDYNVSLYKIKNKNAGTSFFKAKYRIYESYLLLAALENNPEYYDMAYLVIQHSEPMRLKGLYHFRQKEFEVSAECFYKALTINRTEKILFSYGCVLIELKKYDCAIKIYTEFLLFDDKNTKALLNLTNCYFKLNEYEKGLDQLLKVIKYTQRKDLIELYTAMCDKHNIKKKLSKIILN